MIARALAVGIVCAPFISAVLLGLGRAGRALRTTWTYWPDKGRRRHQIAYAVLHPHLIAYGLWLWATHQEQPMTTTPDALTSATPKPRNTARFGVGMPAGIHLDSFARDIADAYGHLPYLVGTAARFKQWRDVDVRLLLPDLEFDALFPDYAECNQLDPRWALLCAAISELGKLRTGLPIDFQFQRLSDANARYDGPRHPLGVRIGGAR